MYATVVPSQSGLRCFRAQLYKSSTWNTVSSWQAKILTWRCEGAYSNTQTLRPLRGLSKICLRCSLAVPPSNWLSPWESCSEMGPSLWSPGHHFFTPAFTFRAELPQQAPAGDLSSSGSSAYLRLPSSPISPCHLHLLTPTSPLSCLESSLKTIFLFLPVFPPPLLLNSMAIVNLVPLAAASFDTESSIPQLGWALLEARRRTPGGWKGKFNLWQ